MTTLTVACVQMTSGDQPDVNLATIVRLAEIAAGNGSRLIAFPENCLLMPAPGAFAAFPVYTMETHPGVDACRELARRLNVHVLLGSVAIRDDTLFPSKPYNRQILIAPDGSLTGIYDKMHLYDVTLPDGEEYRESARFSAGDRAVLAEVDGMRLGLTICYDLRFPYLHRALAQAGAQALTIPAAFTYTTGKAHWHVLLRARAIETGSYVLAPAQAGMHPGGRRTYGHAMIIGPWGEVLAEAAVEGEDLIYATLDTEEVT
jgi:predicted amidohydrolase